MWIGRLWIGDFIRSVIFYSNDAKHWQRQKPNQIHSPLKRSCRTERKIETTKKMKTHNNTELNVIKSFWVIANFVVCLHNIQSTNWLEACKLHMLFAFRFNFDEMSPNGPIELYCWIVTIKSVLCLECGQVVRWHLISIQRKNKPYWMSFGIAFNKIFGSAL